MCALLLKKGRRASGQHQSKRQRSLETSSTVIGIRSKILLIGPERGGGRGGVAHGAFAHAKLA